MKPRLELLVSRTPFGVHRRILPTMILPNGRVALMKGPVEFQEHPDHEVAQEHHLMTIDETAAQKLMDQLWDTGLRPTQGAGSAGQLAATQAHLHDMRALVFKGKVTP